MTDSGSSSSDAGSTRPVSESSPRLGPRLEMVGPYRILERLGEGGFGEVYAAEQTKPMRRRVAVKVIKAGMDTRTVLARFEAERQALAMMDHPNIAKVLDGGATDEGRPYFVMELVKGEPLTTYCDRHTLPTQQRLALFVQVCQAVQHAHQKGIIHRDIKPSNILVTVADGRPLPKVIDFGVAKATGKALTEKTVFTHQGQLIGTPEYMSPEQAEMGALDVDTRTDVYSLGVVLYELLTGTLPFPASELRRAGLAEIQRMIRETDPPRPSTRVSTLGKDAAAVARRRHTDVARLTRQLSGELDWILLKALEKDRTRRYGTASFLAQDIERYLHDEPVSARPPSLGYTLRKAARRHSVALSIAGSVFVGLLGVAVALSYSLVESRRQQRATAEALSEAEAARDFLTDMLKAADPAEMGKDVTVRQVVDAAAQDIDARFEDRPLLRAQVEDAIGTTYFALGDYERAQRFLEPALGTRRELLGPGDERTLETLTSLAWTFGQQAEWTRMEDLLREGLASSRSVLGEKHPTTIRLMANLGDIMPDPADWEEGAELIEQAWQLVQELPDADEELEVGVLTALAGKYNWEKRYPEALDAYTELLARQERRLGVGHPETLTIQYNLAATYCALERYEEAHELFAENVAARKRAFGPDHPEVHDARLWLAWALEKAGRLGEAESEILGSMRDFGAALQSDGPRRHYVQMRLANIYMAQGRYTEAEELYREGVEASRRLNTGYPESTQAGIYVRDLGLWAKSLRALGQVAEAADAFEEGYRVAESSGLPGMTRDLAVRIAAFYDSLGSEEEAATWKARVPPGDDAP